MKVFHDDNGREVTRRNFDRLARFLLQRDRWDGRRGEVAILW